MPNYYRGLLLALTVAASGAIAQPCTAPLGGPQAGGPGYGPPQSRPQSCPSRILEQQVAKLRALLSGQMSQNPTEMRHS
jgi:hypothetical protein